MNPGPSCTGSSSSQKKTGACVKYIDPDARTSAVLLERIAPILAYAYASANDSGVVVEFFDFVFDPDALEKILSYMTSTR